MIPVSLLSSYLYCPRKVFLDKVLLIAEPSRAAVVKGNISHSVHERINKADELIVKGLVKPQTAESINNIYRKHYATILKNVIFENISQLRAVRLEPARLEKTLLKLVLAEAGHRAENVSDFMSKNNVYGDRLWQMLTPKIKAEYKLSSEKLQLSGVVDELEIFENKIVPIELKSGRAPKEGTWPGQQLQVAAYIMLLEEMFSTTISKGMIRYVDENITRDAVMNPFLREKVTDTRDKVLGLLDEQNTPPFATNENKCRSCDLRAECHDEQSIAEKKAELQAKANNIKNQQ